MRKMNRGMAALAAAAAIMTALPTGVMAATNSAQAAKEIAVESTFANDEREPRPVDENGKAINEDGSEVAEADLLPAPDGEMGGAPGQFMGQNGQMNQNGEKPELGQMPSQMNQNGEMPQFDGREPRPVDENGKAINEDGSEVAEADLGEAPEKPEGMQNGERPEMNAGAQNGQRPEMNSGAQNNRPAERR